MANEISAFLSYSRTVDANDVARFRDAVQRAVREQGFQSFKIFFDKIDMSIGNWQDLVRVELEKSSMMLVIISPGLLLSEPCEFEIKTFLQIEKERGKKIGNLVPFYFVEVPNLAARAAAGETVAAAVTAHNYFDFRHLRVRNSDNAEYRLKIIEVAEKLAERLNDDLASAAPAVGPAQSRTSQNPIDGHVDGSANAATSAAAEAVCKPPGDNEHVKVTTAPDSGTAGAQADPVARTKESIEAPQRPGREKRLWIGGTSIAALAIIVGIALWKLLPPNPAPPPVRSAASALQPGPPAAAAPPPTPAPSPVRPAVPPTIRSLDKTCVVGMITNGDLFHTRLQPDESAPPGPDLRQGQPVPLTGEVVGTDWLQAKEESEGTFYLLKTACRS